MKLRLTLMAFLAIASVVCLAQGNHKPAPAGTWKIGTWGACSNGVQVRTVQCVNSAGIPIIANACPAPKPVTELKCASKLPTPKK